MCKYEMDQMSIVDDTEQTQFCPQTDRRTRWNQYTPLSTSLKRGVTQGLGQIVFVFANTNTNTNTAYLYLYLYLIKFQAMYSGVPNKRL